MAQLHTACEARYLVGRPTAHCWFALSRLGYRPRNLASYSRPDLPPSELKPHFHGQISLGSLAPHSPGAWPGPRSLLLGLLTTQASTASLLLNLEAVATAVIAWVIFRENVDKRVGAGFALILLGSIFLSLPQEGGLAISGGALLIAAACLCWGIDNNLTRKISSSDPSQIAMWKGFTAGIVNTGLALAVGAKLPAINVTLGVALIGFLGYGVSLVLFVPPDSVISAQREPGPIFPLRRSRARRSPSPSVKVGSIGRSALRAFSCS